MFRLATLTAALPVSAAVAPAGAGHLNVLFIVSDDLRPEMGCYGGQAITPHLDKFAASAGAVLFERSYVQQAICCPTRSSFLTGRRPDATKVWDLHTHFRASGGREWKTLPEFFKDNGYFTAGMGKVFHPVKDPATGQANDVGFSWTAPYFSSGPSAPQSMAMCWNERGNGTHDAPCTGGPHSCTADGTIAAHGVALLQNASNYPDVPFFIAVGIHRPHLPWDVPAHWYSLYPAAEDIALADHNTPPADYGPARNYSWDPQSGYASASSRHHHTRPVPRDHENLRTKCVIPPARSPRHCGPLRALSDPEDPKMGEFALVPDDVARNFRRGYFAAVSATDHNAGQVLDALAALKLEDKTVTIFLGDHGVRDHAAPMHLSFG